MSRDRSYADIYIQINILKESTTPDVGIPSGRRWYFAWAAELDVGISSGGADISPEHRQTARPDVMISSGRRWYFACGR